VKAGQILAALELGLFLAGHEVRSRCICALAAGAGLIAGMAIGVSPPGSPRLRSSVRGFAAGLAVAAGYAGRSGAVLGAVCGLALGASCWPDQGTVPGIVVLALVNAIGVLLVSAGLAYAGGLTAGPQAAHWRRIGLRVAGAWLFAVTCLVLAFSLSQG